MQGGFSVVPTKIVRKPGEKIPLGGIDVDEGLIL
jgi:hypothetical protein